MSGQHFASRYEMISQLGEGGNGVVWKARDAHLNHEVAIKFFRPGTHPGLVFHEAQLHVALAGPHILNVRDATIYNDVPYIVSDLARGGSVERRLEGTAGVDTASAIGWTRHMLSGLIACHAQGLLHRDVKPGNLFLDSGDTAMLGDFGLVERMVNGVAPLAGTAQFFAPELFIAKQFNVQGDIYGAGLTLWMLLTGRHPYLDDSSPTDLPSLGSLAAAGVPRLRDQAPSVPKLLATVAERACHSDPAVRYSTAAAMDQALGDLPRFHRVWVEVSPDGAEDRRWESTAKRTESNGFVVTLSQSGSQYRIETRRNGGACQRSVAHCHDRVPSAQMLPRLRRVFDSLS